MLSGQCTFNSLILSKHKSSALNKVAYALSRRSCLLTIMQIKILGVDLFHELLADDSYFGPIVSNITTGKLADFILQDMFLFKGNRFCVPKGNLTSRLLRSCMTNSIWGAIERLRW